jgi:uncharacterized ion transporter superfamily protein YfcC
MRIALPLLALVLGVPQRQCFLPGLAAQIFVMGRAAGFITRLGRQSGVEANALAGAFRDGTAR